MILRDKVLIGLTLVALQLPTVSIADSTLQSTIDNRIEITLGSKIPNPYSVDELFDVQASDDEKQAAVTHFYIKFKPETADDEAALNNTSNITLSIAPLDYELEQGGNYFRDDSRPMGSRASQYALVKVNQTLPDVPYDILDRLVQPEPTATQRANLTTKGKPRRRLGGSITAWDNDSNSYVPIVGMKITAIGGWFQTYHTTTNASGKFYVPKHFWGFSFSYAWENENFLVNYAKNATFGAAGGITLSLPLIHLDWSNYTKHVKIGNTVTTLTNQELAAHAYRAAHHYFHGDILGTTRPLSRYTVPDLIPIFDKSIKFTIGINPHKVLNWASLGATYYFGPSWEVNERVLLFPGELQGKPSEYLYYLTIHEIAHAIHFDQILNLPSTYPNQNCPSTGCVDAKLRESWAVGVANQITRTRYEGFSSANTQSYKGPYTGLINDLVDDDNLPAVDQVSGYTVKQIESVLKEAVDLRSLVALLENRFDNPTENYLQPLLEYWLEKAKASPPGPAHR